MVDYIPIKHFKVGEKYSQVFYIKSLEKRVSTKCTYGVLTLLDVSGEITGYVWNYTSALPLKVGQWVHLTFIAKEHENKINFIIQPQDIGTVDETLINKSDYFYSIHPNVLKVNIERLNSYIAQIEDPDLRDILGNASVKERLNLVEFMSCYPYGLKNTLSCDGGLIVYTNHLIMLTLSMLDGLKNIEVPLNKSLLIAGAIFRNLGWTSALKKGLIWEPSDSYYLVGIRQASFMIANHICMTTETDLKTQIPEPKKAALFEACLKTSVTDAYTPENQILITANNILDQMIFNESKLLRAKVGQDIWLNGLFIGHHASRPEN